MSDNAVRFVDVYATAERLLRLRAEKGWAASYLAQLAGVQEAVVRRAEKGSFSVVNLGRLVRALGTDVDAVLVWSPYSTETRDGD